MDEFKIYPSFSEFQQDREEYQIFLSLEEEEIKRSKSLVQMADYSNFTDCLVCLVYISYYFILRSEYVKSSTKADLNADAIIDLRQTQVILIDYLLSDHEKLMEALQIFHKEEHEEMGFVKKLVFELFSVRLKDTGYAEKAKQLWKSFQG